MAGADNLKGKGFDSRTTEEQREIARQGGIASGEARRERKNIRLAMEALLEQTCTTSDGAKISGAEAIALKQMEKALKGDAKAFELVRDTAGQKPVEVIEQVNVDAQYNEKMEILKRYLDAGTATDSGTDKE